MRKIVISYIEMPSKVSSIDITNKSSDENNKPSKPMKFLTRVFNLKSGSEKAMDRQAEISLALSQIPKAAAPKSFDRYAA